MIPSARDAHALDYRGGGLIKFRSSDEVGLVTRDHANSILSESFRGALTSILFGSDQPRDSRSHAMRSSGQTLVVTSVDMMEGKTTVLTNLGVVAAERRQRVLLIDADLRRPRLHDIFSVPNDRGLTDVLLRSHAPDAANHLPLESFVRPTSTPGLSVLPTGPVDATSMTLLHSADFHSFLQRCRRDFDLILIDTPPLMLYADARILGRLSDGVVMVVRANTRSQEELRAVCERLRQDQIPVHRHHPERLENGSDPDSRLREIPGSLSAARLRSREILSQSITCAWTVVLRSISPGSWLEIYFTQPVNG